MPSAYASCYTQKQFRAEQALRFHTKLMIVGMLCQGSFQADTYTDYKSFTTRNQTVIRDQENKLINYFTNTKQPNPERALHGMRTDLANYISQQATQSIAEFCKSNKDLWQQSLAMQSNDFKSWIEKLHWTKKTETLQKPCVATH